MRRGLCGRYPIPTRRERNSKPDPASSALGGRLLRQHPILWQVCGSLIPKTEKQCRIKLVRYHLSAGGRLLLLTAFARGCSALFALATVWAITLQGFFEPSRLDVAHLDAGAGDLLLLLRGALAVLATVSLLIAAFFPGPRLTRLFTLIAALLVLPIFLWSAVGRERWAPGYIPAQFSLLSERFHSGQQIPESQVLAALGPPLMTHSDSAHSERWSYSYMPSSGFGWHKRVIVLRKGFVAGFLWIDEP